MPKVKFVDSYTEEVKAERAALNETNDCTVVSLSVLLGVPYLEAHARMRQGGREHRKGRFMHKAAAWANMTQLRGILDKGVTLNQFVTAHPRGRFWVEVRGHALAVVDGVVHDHSHKPRRVLRNAWKVPT